MITEMNIYKNIVLTLFLTIISNVFVFSQSQKETRNILVLFSFNPSTPAYASLLDGLRLKLKDEFGDSYTLYTDYLETENYPDGKYPKEKFDLYNEKYKHIKLDLLICVGRNIIRPIKECAENYLLNLPTISIDFDFSNYGYPSDLKLNEKTFVIAIKLNIEKTISTALALFPKTTSIYFIGGSSPSDTLLMSISRNVTQKMKIEKITFLSDLAMDDILKQINHLPENTIIIVPSFSTDGNFVPYNNPNAVRIISREANMPVFAYANTGIEGNSIGGYVISFNKISQLSGDVVIDILNSKSIKYPVVTENDFYEYIFDWRELKKWGIDESGLIPPESKILFKEIDFVSKYNWYIGLALLFLILQTILIIKLIRLNRQQKIMTQQILKSEKKYRNFLHEDRVLRLGHITASLSHELNQPLTAMLSTAQAGINFINSKEASMELLKNILEKIVDSNKRTSLILSSIRRMMKYESREKEKVNINLIVNEVIEIYKSEAIKFNIKLSVSLLNEPVYILADKIQIQQVILNFTHNAIQSMENSSAINKLILISLYLEQNNVIVTVRDYGEGINESLMNNLFTAFFTTKKEGAGIGLAICQTIIEEHQGKIWAENLSDGGAKFSFSLKVYNDKQVNL